jgi:hypothetical protein
VKESSHLLCRVRNGRIRPNLKNPFSAPCQGAKPEPIHSLMVTGIAGGSRFKVKSALLQSEMSTVALRQKAIDLSEVF